MSAVIELILSPRHAQVADELERAWRAREAEKRWSTEDETLVRIRDWLKRQPG